MIRRARGGGGSGAEPGNGRRAIFECSGLDFRKSWADALKEKGWPCAAGWILRSAIIRSCSL